MSVRHHWATRIASAPPAKLSRTLSRIISRIRRPRPAPERQADGQIVAPPREARELDAGQVGARDEQQAEAEPQVSQAARRSAWPRPSAWGRASSTPLLVRCRRSMSAASALAAPWAVASETPGCSRGPAAASARCIRWPPRPERSGPTTDRATTAGAHRAARAASRRSRCTVDCRARCDGRAPPGRRRTGSATAGRSAGPRRSAPAGARPGGTRAPAGPRRNTRKKSSVTAPPQVRSGASPGRVTRVTSREAIDTTPSNTERSARYSWKAPTESSRPLFSATVRYRRTIRSGFGWGKGRSRSASTSENIAVEAPSPRARVTTASTLKPGWRRSVRAAKRSSRNMITPGAKPSPCQAANRPMAPPTGWNGPRTGQPDAAAFARGIRGPGSERAKPLLHLVVGPQRQRDRRRRVTLAGAGPGRRPRPIAPRPQDLVTTRQVRATPAIDGEDVRLEASRSGFPGGSGYPFRVRTGLDVLLLDDARFAQLKGRRVALLGHPASMTGIELGFRHALDALAEKLGRGAHRRVRATTRHARRQAVQHGRVAELHRPGPRHPGVQPVRRGPPAHARHARDLRHPAVRSAGHRLAWLHLGGDAAYMLEACAQVGQGGVDPGPPQSGGRPIEGSRPVPGPGELRRRGPRPAAPRPDAGRDGPLHGRALRPVPADAGGADAGVPPRRSTRVRLAVGHGLGEPQPAVPA